MNETQVRQAVFRAARAAGYWPITQTDASKCPRCGNLIRPPLGRPDLLLMNPIGRSAVVEVKTVRPKETAFAFASIEEPQRKWLNYWHDEDGPAYIALGVIRQHGKVQMLEHLYLVPWERWLMVEKAIGPIQSSIPVEAGKGMRLELQEGELDIVHLFADLELERVEGEYQWPS